MMARFDPMIQSTPAVSGTPMNFGPSLDWPNPPV